MNGAGKVVCVTGASGYIASWLVKLLLHRGYTVKATVRNLGDPTNVDHLKALEGAEERLHLFQANLTEDGSFDSAIDGCDAVFHTASPCFFSSPDPQVELIEPAKEGALNVLRSCSKVPSVRRVVLTSSMAAVVANRNAQGTDVLIDETWFSDPEYCQELKLWYPLSKILAERAAWKFAEENGIDLVVLNPGYVIGPVLQPTLNFSSALFVDLVKGKGQYPPPYKFVDVRDIANAHIIAFENPSANGRYCLAPTLLSNSELMTILQKLYPDISAPAPGTIENPVPQSKVSKKKAESLGISFRPVEESLKDGIESLKEKGFLTQ